MIAGKFLVFLCQGKKYAIELSRAREVRVADSIQSIPVEDKKIMGIYNLRGKILQVKDLGQILHQEKTTLAKNSVLLYLDSSHATTTVVIDQLLGICSSEEVDWSESIPYEENNQVVIDFFTWQESLIQVLSIDKLAA